jgi:transcriptional regulator with XRE-family HTH domain
MLLTKRSGELMAKKFHELLQEQLEAKGVTPYRLRQLTGLSAGAVSKLVNGESMPTWDSLLKICKALGVTCEAFVVEVELPEPSPERPKGRPAREKGEPSKEKALKRPKKGK